jgi:hypothetical protein
LNLQSLSAVFAYFFRLVFLMYIRYLISHFSLFGENGYRCLCALFCGNLAFKNATFLENIWESGVSQSQTQTVTAGTSYVVADMVWCRQAIRGKKIIDGGELYNDEYKKNHKKQ